MRLRTLLAAILLGTELVRQLSLPAVAGFRIEGEAESQGAPVSTEKDSTKEALELLSASLTCPSSPFEDPRGWGAKVLEKNTFSGDATTFRNLSNRRVVLSTRTEAWEEKVSSQFDYRRLNRIVVQGMTVEVDCYSCISVSSTNDRSTIANDLLEYRWKMFLCDEQAADNVGAALEYLRRR